MPKFGVREWRASRGPPRILCRPFDELERAAQRADTHPMRGAYGTRIRTQLLFGVLLCLPTAPELPLQETETSVRLRFFGQHSDKPLPAHI
jgi:hypothetical protein